MPNNLQVSNSYGIRIAFYPLSKVRIISISISAHVWLSHFLPKVPNFEVIVFSGFIVNSLGKKKASIHASFISIIHSAFSFFLFLSSQGVKKKNLCAEKHPAISITYHRHYLSSAEFPLPLKRKMDGLGDDGMGFDPPMMNHTPQLFNYDHTQMQAGAMYDDSSLGAGDETNDAKRRRIARVRIIARYRD